jgi:hypothetical protein
MARQHVYSLGPEPGTGAGHFQHRAERLLFQVPVYIAAALGAGLMLSRFVLVIGDKVRSSPDDRMGVLVLAAMIGAASLIVVAAFTVAGAMVGYALRAMFEKGLAGRFSNRLAKHR